MGKIGIEKYYIPTIDEFYVGFEYERCDNGYNYFKDIYPNNVDQNKLENYITYFRVKYLDVEDIESFGFTHTASLKDYHENFRIEKLFRRLNEDYDSTMWVNVYIKYAPDIHRVTILGDISDGSLDEKFFEGVIKNKSELKKLLIQLNIIEK